LLYEGDQLIDSAALDDRHTFTIERTVDEPAMFTLLVGDQAYSLLLQNGDDLTFRADLAQGGDYDVDGSEVNTKLKILNRIRAALDAEQNALMDTFEQRIAAGEDPAAVRAELTPRSEEHTSELQSRENLV